jgi:hypothetical protein
MMVRTIISLSVVQWREAAETAVVAIVLNEKMDRSLSSSETRRYRPSVAEPYVKITKNISSAFTAAFAVVSSNANTLDDRYFGSLEEDEQPPLLKGIEIWENPMTL